MFVTVTIQTYNRADCLRQTLRSLESLRCPDGIDYEILVVDNNSTDQTADVVRESRASLEARLRYVTESRQGISHARNRAIAEARGDVVCFIDDDVLVDSGWLAGHVDTYRADSRTVAVGGRVLLQWPEGWTRPAWLTPDLQGCLSGLDVEAEGPFMRFPRYPFGCNMSVRRDVAQQIGGFHPELGRKKSGLISNEEKLFFRQIHAHGDQVAYAQEALVYHVVPWSRLTKTFFLRRAYAQGISDIIFLNATKPGGQTFLWNLRQVATGMLRTGWALVVAGARCVPGAGAGAFASLVRAGYMAGYVVRAARTLMRFPRSADDSGIDCWPSKSRSVSQQG
jgi:glycosyltransferase involved in cell wall biosynthesis